MSRTLAKLNANPGGIRDAIATPELLQRIVLLVQMKIPTRDKPHWSQSWPSRNMANCVRAIIATPEVVQRILTLHHDREWLVRETMVKTIIDLLKYRTHARKRGILQRIISLIEDEDWDVRQAVLRALASLAEHAEIRMVISGQDVVHTVISLLGHDSRWVRRTSLEAMIALSEFKDIWTSTGITELKSERGRMLNDGDENIRYDAIQLIVTLCEHEVLHEALYDTEILHQVVSILDDADEDVRGAAVGATLALSRPRKNRLESITTPVTVTCAENAPPALAAPEVQERIILKLADPHSVVREASLVAVTQFLKQNLKQILPLSDNAFRAITGGEKCYHRQFSSSGGEENYLYDKRSVLVVRVGALEAVTALLRHTEPDGQRLGDDSTSETPRDVIAEPEVAEGIFSMMDDTDSDVRQGALKAVVAPSEHDGVRRAITLPLTLQKIASMLGENDQSVRAEARDTIVTISQLESIRVAITAPQMLQKIIWTLFDEDGDVRSISCETIAALSKLDDGRASIMEAITSMLGNQSGSVRERGLDAVVALVSDPDLRNVLATGGMIKNVTSRL
ncbi:armadillo-type protein [Mycena olivaceomarginata]|nr:armadillo-type protein [Mycena olivaceomarginata]